MQCRIINLSEGIGGASDTLDKTGRPTVRRWNQRGPKGVTGWVEVWGAGGTTSRQRAEAWDGNAFGQQAEASGAEQECPGKSRGHVSAELAKTSPGRPFPRCYALKPFTLGCWQSLQTLKLRQENRIKCPALKHVNQFRELKEHGRKNWQHSQSENLQNLIH